LPEDFPCSGVNYLSTCHLCLFITRGRCNEPLIGRSSSYRNYFTPLSEKLKIIRIYHNVDEMGPTLVGVSVITLSVNVGILQQLAYDFGVL